MILLVIILLLFGATIYSTDRVARWEGRLTGFRDADRCHQEQRRLDYERGVCDGIRQAARWLRDHGQKDAANSIPTLLINGPKGGRQP